MERSTGVKSIGVVEFYIQSFTFLHGYLHPIVYLTSLYQVLSTALLPHQHVYLSQGILLQRCSILQCPWGMCILMSCLIRTWSVAYQHCCIIIQHCSKTHHVLKIHCSTYFYVNWHSVEGIFWIKLGILIKCSNNCEKNIHRFIGNIVTYHQRGYFLS